MKDININSKTKTITATGYTPRELYSVILNEFDKRSHIDDDIPVNAVPTAYKIKLINGWKFEGIDLDEEIRV